MSRFSLIFDTDTDLASGATAAANSDSQKLFDAPLDELSGDLRHSRYNISRDQKIIVLVSTDDGALAARTMLWGFTPHWIHSPNPALQPLAIADNKITQPYFREAFQQRRCLIPASGFYAWQGWENGPDAPYYVRMRDHRPFLMAAVWDICENIERVAMITTTANSLVQPIHERMPAIIPTEQADAWLRGANPQRLLQPYPTDAMEIHQVSHKIFAARNEGAQLIEPVSAAKSTRSDKRRSRIGRIDNAAYAHQ